MKKIPTLFVREFEGHSVCKTLPQLTDESFNWVLNGEGVATIKHDGACCAVISGKFYKRYDAKNGKKAPDGAIPCCDPDPITGHWPHWIEVNNNKPEDRWFIEAMNKSKYIYPIMCKKIEDGTYEAIGPHFNANHHKMPIDVLIRHGSREVNILRTYDGIKYFLKYNNVEGLVFWKDGEPKCKIKRSDFGFNWPDEGSNRTWTI